MDGHDGQTGSDENPVYFYLECASRSEDIGGFPGFPAHQAKAYGRLAGNFTLLQVHFVGTDDRAGHLLTVGKVGEEAGCRWNCKD